jgi:hypothetical protein
MVTSVVRVAIHNNFNCTEPEWNHLDNLAAKNPDKAFFVNSNIYTPLLHTISDHEYKAVITANPNITVDFNVLDKLSLLHSHIAFVRVKYLPDRPLIESLIDNLTRKGFPVVLSLQRFNSKKSLSAYTNLCYYKFFGNRSYLIGKPLADVNALVRKFPKTWICDKRGVGCQGCNLCSTLVLKKRLRITAVNLSTSGLCPFNCPDCYAKTMQSLQLSFGHRPIIYDKIRQNAKQAGYTAHIRLNKKKKGGIHAV